MCVLAAGLVGCDRSDRPHVQQEPKEAGQSAATTQPSAGQPAVVQQAAEQSDDIRWTVPAGWKEMPPKPMRRATFAVAGEQSPVVVTVIPLGLEAGGVLPNVNRWEEQVGLPKSPEADLGKVVRRITVGGTPTDMVDLVGPAAAAGNQRPRMLGAMMTHGQQVWFFKLLGPDDVVGPQKENFEAFVKSIRFGA
jgi:hypothetical protein